MKLHVNYESLWKAARRITDARERLELNLTSGWQAPKYDVVVDELRVGKDVSLEEIDVTSKLLNFKGRHVLLYIADHGSQFEGVMRGTKEAHRFHVANCETLTLMRKQGRYQRYVATTDLSGLFKIVGVAENNHKIGREGYITLRVCQNCLKTLNYKNARNGGVFKIAKTFNVREFFETYASLFKVPPNQREITMQMALYTRDWAEVSRSVRAKADWCCQACKVNLKNHPELLHTHHVNGVKNDNRTENLVALCIGCHRQQPNHAHLDLSHKNMMLLNRLRREQGLLGHLSWDDVMRFADPSLQGALALCRRDGWSVPQVEYLYDSRHFDIAWPHSKIAIDLTAQVKTEKAGWTIYSLGDFLDEFKLKQYGF